MLTPTQIRAAELLSQGTSHQEVADAVGVSRRTILRWLNSAEFKNWQYALISRPRTPEKVPKPPRPRIKADGSLQPSDLVQDALEAIQDILCDPVTRVSDRLRAAVIAGEWAGLSHRGKTQEGEALKVLIAANWVSDEVLETLVDGWAEVESKIKNVLANGHNGHKKAPPQESEEETFDDEFDDDEFDD